MWELLQLLWGMLQGATQGAACEAARLILLWVVRKLSRSRVPPADPPAQGGEASRPSFTEQHLQKLVRGLQQIAEENDSDTEHEPRSKS